LIGPGGRGDEARAAASSSRPCSWDPGKLRPPRSVIEKVKTLTISDSTFDKIREAWQAQIPEPYRCVGHDRGNGNHSYGAIVAPPPPVSVVANFLAHVVFGSQHLAADQRKAIEARKNCGRPGRRVQIVKPGSKTRQRSRARRKPSNPGTVSVNDSALPAIADQLGGLA
jgi:hypothetical protein